MSEIILKLPKRKNKIEIIKNNDNNQFLGKRKCPSIYETKSNEEEYQHVASYITHKFVIKDTQKPIQISLDNIPTSSISLSEAQLEIQSAYDKGFSDGQEASQVVYENEILNYKNRIYKIEEVIENLRLQYFVNMTTFEEKLVETSVIVAEHLIANEVNTNNNIVINTLRKSLDELNKDKIFEIYINPNDYDTLTKVKSTIFTNESLSKNIEIISDSNIKQGGVLLNTSTGIIDARIETQLNKIKELLKENIINSNILGNVINFEEQPDDDKINS